MSDEAEVQPEAGEGRARRARKAKAAPAEPRPAEVQPEVVVTVSNSALLSEADRQDVARVVEAHTEVARAVRPSQGGVPALTLAPFRAYVARVPGWGPLHCVLHDGSLDDEAVARAQQDARALRDAEALALAELLGSLDVAGRRAVREALATP